MTSARVAMCLVPLLVAAAPAVARADGTFSVGAGFSTEDGFVAGATVEQNDLFHTGQHLALVARLSARTQEFLLEHDVPDLLGSGLDLHTELFDRRRVYPGFARDGAGGAVTVGHRLGGATRAYLRAGVEDVSMEMLGGTPRSTGPDPGGGLYTTLGAGIVYDTLDDPQLPYHGTRLELYGERSDRRLGSSHDFVRLRASLDHAQPLGPFTLRVHGAAAYIRARNGDEVPLSERFQHDGFADLRGYPIGSFGAGGADFEANGRVELELPVWRRAGLSVAAFADAGVLGTTLHRAVGVSILWHSPIGLLRFDWALPLDRSDSQAIVFGFGTSF